MRLREVLTVSGLSGILFLALVITVPVELASRQHSSQTKPTLPVGRAVRFHLVGDYGALTNTSDTASLADPLIPVQIVAEQMANRSLTFPIDFIATTGDNVYPDGMEDVFDAKQFSLMYEIFRLPGIWGKPWYPVLGNHDCENTPPMVDISKFYPMWNLDAQYYAINLELDNNATAVMIFLNGCTIACEEKLIYCDYHYTQGEIEAQYAWLESVLQSSAGATWRLAFIHMPPFSAGIGSGDDEALKQRLYPLLSNYKVDFLFAGHDHLSEYLFSHYDSTYVPGATDTTGLNCSSYREYLSPLVSNPLVLSRELGGLHEVIVGSSGHALDTLCVNRTTSMAQLLFGSTTYGWAEVEVSSEHVTVNFMSIDSEEALFTLRVEA